jgi:Putative DNA-binding domain
VTLLTLQQDFRSALLVDEMAEDTPFGVAASDGMKVYRNAYRSRLMNCLRSSYDKVWSWVGDEAFDAAACHHIILHPPRSWTLDDYGEGFDQTLKSLFPDDPEVPELAWLEWVMARAFASLDQPIVKPADLASADVADLDWDKVRLAFVGSLQMREIQTNCTGLWLSLTNGTEMPERILCDTPVFLSVWRKEFSPQFRVLDTAEREGLQMMQSGATFGALCTKMSALLGTDQAVAAAGSMLGRWVGEEMVTSLETAKE